MILCPDCRTAFEEVPVTPRPTTSLPPHPCSVDLMPVAQYGRFWQLHVLAGGEVRQGNLLVLPHGRV